MQCKQTVYRGEAGRGQCSRNAVKDGWCKQHWMHPFYAVWIDRLECAMEAMPKCKCAWGDVVSPAYSDDLPEGADERVIGTVSLSCIDCQTRTEYLPLASEGDLDALKAAWAEAVAGSGQ